MTISQYLFLENIRINQILQQKISAKPRCFGGKRWIRTIEDEVDGFTVRCIWPLCNLPITTSN